KNWWLSLSRKWRQSLNKALGKSILDFSEFGNRKAVVELDVVHRKRLLAGTAYQFGSQRRAAAVVHQRQGGLVALEQPATGPFMHLQGNGIKRCAFFREL